MTQYWGAFHNLETRIKVHLFIICPNNSGSTLLRKLLEQSPYAWKLQKEAQHVPGFVGPSSRGTGMRLLWASRQSWIDQFTSNAAYNWMESQQAWYFHSKAASSQACVFVTSSPPFLLIMDELKRHFDNARFLIMVRDPYAAIEGIYRRRKLQPVPESLCYGAAAQHMIRCFEYQRHNVKCSGAESIVFTYEQLCKKSDEVKMSIESLVPELGVLDFQSEISVKGEPPAPICNMNDSQIDQINEEGFTQINRIFEKKINCLNYFGYDLREKKDGGITRIPA